MKDFSKLRIALNLSGGVESLINTNTDKNLEEGVKRSTKKLLEINPEITKEEIISYLILSAQSSYLTMISSNSLELTISSYIDLIKLCAKDDEDEDELSSEEECVLKCMLKNKLTTDLLHKSFNISLKAATEVWNGIKGMES